MRAQQPQLPQDQTTPTNTQVASAIRCCDLLSVRWSPRRLLWWGTLHTLLACGRLPAALFLGEPFTRQKLLAAFLAALGVLVVTLAST